MKVLYLLMLVSTAAAEREQIVSSLDEIKSVLSTVIVRLERIENRQTTHGRMFKILKKINKIQKDQAQKHAESLLWYQNTMSLLTELKVKDEGLETQQKTMMSQLNQMVNNSDRCCHENITVTCVNPSYQSTPTTQLSTTPATPTAMTSTTPTTLTTTTPAQQDCKTVDQRGALKDGVYQLAAGNQQMQVFCAGGYVTFQRRYNGQLKFDKTFSEYEQGFGAASSEHWMGLRYLHLMTKEKSCTFRARLAVDNTLYNKGICRGNIDCNGQVKEVVVRDFRVSSAADKYRVQFTFNHTDLHHPYVKYYTEVFNGQRFTTKDQDNDQKSGNCAVIGLVVGGGFWYNNCGVYLNSVYSSDKRRCSNSVCGHWYPYYISSTLLQFSC